MCQYCSSMSHDGWTALLEYDPVYTVDVEADSQSTYSFHETPDDRREDVGSAEE